MIVQIVTMTPDWATKILERNTRNRPVKRRNLDRLTRAMAEGRFHLNGESIQIDSNGDLLNGQHRLWACLESNVSFQTVLVEGLPPESQDTIDTGTSRLPGDQLHLHGYSNATALAGAVRQIFGYLDGTGQSAVADVTQMLPFLETHPDLTEVVRLGGRARAVVAPSIISAVVWLGSRAPEHAARAHSFVEPLDRGEGLSAGDPRLALRNTMLNVRMRNSSRSPRADYSISATTHAWNAFVSGRSLSLVKAIANAKGRYEQPPILGAPPPGSGLDSLSHGAAVMRSGKSFFRR